MGFAVDSLAIADPVVGIMEGAADVVPSIFIVVALFIVAGVADLEVDSIVDDDDFGVAGNTLASVFLSSLGNNSDSVPARVPFVDSVVFAVLAIVVELFFSTADDSVEFFSGKKDIGFVELAVGVDIVMAVDEVRSAEWDKTIVVQLYKIFLL